MNITQRYLEMMRAEAKIYPAHTNRASSLGHPCMRYLVYCRTHWEEKRLPDPVLQSIFGLGHSWEDLAGDRLRKMGYVLYESQRSLSFAEEQISGHIDAMCTHPEWDGYPSLLHVCDIKSSSPHVWDRLNSLEDLRNHKLHYIRAYIDQIMLYLFLRAENENQKGVLFFFNKVTAVPREIWIDLDEALPDRIKYDKGVCGRCDYRHVCLPDLDDAVGLVWLEDDDLLASLNRRDEIAFVANEHKGIDKEVKDALKARYEQGDTKIVLGDWLIEGRQDSRGAWRSNIERIDPEETEE
jgi:hypothetical protein